MQPKTALTKAIISVGKLGGLEFGLCGGMAGLLLEVEGFVERCDSPGLNRMASAIETPKINRRHMELLTKRVDGL